ncbi:hypothetical protein PK28_15215 [Hymenobacter sp. DG25B]|uniref:DUF3089 domain-containing protein n=1 Tax=Hymenobacter sp. DG25B TaxID=1385664 RepID=UPI0005406FD0|nr:DUF3089 domain-containing protein [Hymenobacter sp. DG25B]AIZ65285.1 hypothetical protein PK28_15215 [Hymenobacter sp. DG25B]
MRLLLLVKPARVAVALLLLASAGCIKVIQPGKSFAAYTPPASPDYSLPANWAALPERRDSADAVPKNSGLRDEQAQATADVFFVHPTTYFRRGSWNADITNESLNRFTDNSTIRKQASVFNAAGRIYAPRYRQATLFSFFDTQDTNGEQALNLAYTDVKTAFQYYLAHYNQGRPIIIASHSQGTFHATRLLHEFFDTSPQLRKQLVAAYLVGYKVKENEYQALKPCEDSTQTGCYISWNTAEWGNEYEPFRGSTAVNPLTWTRDTVTAPASLNKGGVRFDFDKIDPQVVDAKVHDGIVWVHAPKPIGYPRFLLPGRPELRHSFHIADYSLFYLNVRQNAAARVQAFRNSQ